MKTQKFEKIRIIIGKKRIIFQKTSIEAGRIPVTFILIRIQFNNGHFIAYLVPSWNEQVQEYELKLLHNSNYILFF